MKIFSVILFCLGIAVQQAVCERYHIVTSPDSPCPGERNGVFCFTLQQFISNIRISQHLTLELEPGIHTIQYYSFYASGTSLVEIIGHEATILCSPASFFFSVLDFWSIEQVNIHGITFIDCPTIYLHDVYNATISESRFDTLRLSSAVVGLDSQFANVSIHSCTFVGQSTGIHLRSTNISIHSCDFLGNRHGIYLSHSEVVILDSTFRDNSISGSGSAIYMHQTNSLSVINSNFVRNTASRGGAIYMNRANSLSVINSGFYNNTASSSGGAIYMGVHSSSRSSGSVSTLTIDRCIFANNTGYQGGALYINIYYVYWNLYPSRFSNCTVNRSVFVNNKATVSGGVISTVGDVSIMNSIFGYNTAPQCAVLATRTSSQPRSLQHFESSIFLYNNASNATTEEDDLLNLGGVACARDTSFVVHNCTFSHNMAKDGGGVLHAEDSNVTINSSSFYNNSAGIDGGVLYTYWLASTFVLTGCSFSNNRAGDDGGAIYIGKTRSTLDISRSSFSHNIANDRGGAIIVFGSTIKTRENDMHNNGANSGDDIGVCTASNVSGLATHVYFTYFQQQTYSTECTFYGRLTRTFYIPTPEDHSNTNLAQYLEMISETVNQYPRNNPFAITFMPSTMNSTADQDTQIFNYLRDKLTETSAIQYTLLTFSLLFVVILVVVIATKLCSKKKARKAESLSSNNHGKYNTSHEYNESVEIYEEPVWKDDRSNAIKVKPNVGYAKSTF